MDTKVKNQETATSNQIKVQIYLQGIGTVDIKATEGNEEEIIILQERIFVGKNIQIGKNGIRIEKID